VAYVWGKRDLKTAKKLRKKIQQLGISYDRLATDDWDSFIAVFAEDNQSITFGWKYGYNVLVKG
jgi:IS1 family transposase